MNLMNLKSTKFNQNRALLQVLEVAVTLRMTLSQKSKFQPEFKMPKLTNQASTTPKFSSFSVVWSSI
jgi:hypothetical protein